MIRLIIILLLLPFNLSAQDKLEFIGEKIDFSINDIRFSTNGIFIFANNTEHEIRQTILFPFAKEADSIWVKRVYNLTYSENLGFQHKKNGIAFKLIVLSKDTVILNIFYSQKTDKVNEYILESTQTWNNPLQKAEYSLTYENSIIVDSLSLKPDTTINNIYYWTKTDFYPKENFKVWVK